MRLNQILHITIISILLAACSNDRQQTGETNEPIEILENSIFPDIESAELFDKLRPTPQKFQVSGNIDNLIAGESGTRVFIPKNCFVDENMKAVKGNIEIELVEVLSTSDFIKSNLHTVSNGQPLVSEGMLYINAKADGQPIAIAKGKKLQIELPNKTYSPIPTDTRIFSGSYNESGNINWTETGMPENKMIYLPLDLFDYSFWSSFGFIRPDDGDGYGAPFDDEIIDSTTYKQPHLEKTFIATREFEERFNAIRSAESAIGHHYSFYTTAMKKGRMIMDSTITNIYLNNLDKDLWYCDSLAYTYVKEYEQIDGIRPHYYNECAGCYWNFTETFKKFYEQRLTTVIKLDYSDVNLDEADAREQLAKQGLSTTETDEILGAYKRQKQIIQSRKDKETTRSMVTNTFKVATLGWINCDYFFNDLNAKEVNIIATVTNLEENQFVSLSLVVNNRRMALGGSSNDNGGYSFTGKAEPYTKLPIGDKATIIALSYKDKIPFISMTEIEISEKGNYELVLEASSIEDINDRLKKIN
jgi:hypothetical protein